MSQEIQILLSLRTAAAVEKLHEFVGETTRGLRELAAQAAELYLGFEGLNKLKDVVEESIQLEVEIGRLSEKTGLAIPLITSLHFQAEALQIPFATLNVALSKFSENVFNAAQQGGRFADEFQLMGISATDASGKMRAVNDILIDTAKWFKAHADGAEKAAIAQTLFGRSGREMITMLNEGAEGIEKMQAEGSPISEKSVASAIEFTISLQELHRSIDEIGIVIANQLLPSLIRASNALKQMVDSVRDQGSVISAFIGLVKGIISVVSVAALVFYDLGEAIGIAMEGGYSNIGIFFDAVKIILEDIDRMIVDTIKLFFDLSSSVGVTAQVAALSATGHWVDALKVVGDAAKRVTGDIKDVYGDAKDAAQVATEATKAGFKNSFDHGMLLLDDLKKQWGGLSDFLSSMWSDKPINSPEIKPGSKMAADFFGPNNDDLKMQAAFNALQDEEYKQQLKLIESDPYLTKIQKAQELIPIYNQQLKVLNDQWNAEKALNEASQTDDKKIATAKELYKIRGQINELSNQSRNASALTSISSQVKLAGVSLLDSWGSVAQQIGGSFKTIIGGAVSSVSNGITGLIMGTKTWGQALMQISNTILTSIINAIVQMGVRWIATQLMMAIFGKAIQASATAALVPVAAAQSAIWATPATLATIASYGSAALSAPAFITAAEGITMASIAGRERGGPVSAGVPYVVGEKRPELFVPSTSGYIMPSVPSPVAGMAQSGNQGGNQINQQFAIHNWNDEAAMTAHIRDNPEVNHILIDKMKRNVHVIGART